MPKSETISMSQEPHFHTKILYLFTHFKMVLEQGSANLNIGRGRPYGMIHILYSISKWTDDMSHGSEFLFSVDSEVSEIDTNDWSEWIIENYFSWFCRTEIIYFWTQRKKNFTQKPFFEETNWQFEIARINFRIS